MLFLPKIDLVDILVLLHIVLHADCSSLEEQLGTSANSSEKLCLVPVLGMILRTSLSTIVTKILKTQEKKKLLGKTMNFKYTIIKNLSV